jgi:hypothetical protein
LEDWLKAKELGSPKADIYLLKYNLGEISEDNGEIKINGGKVSTIKSNVQAEKNDFQQLDRWLTKKLNSTRITEGTIERKINGVFEDKVSAIKNAIQKEQLIKFDYKKSVDFANGEKSIRTIKPTEISSIGITDSVCVKGYCFLRKEERTFAVSRITNLIINPKEIN